MTLLLIVLAATAGAAVFTLAEEAPSVTRSLGDPPVGVGGAVPVSRALRVGRLALLTGSAAGLAGLLGWWREPPLGAALTITLTAGLVYLLGDAVPRALGLLMPDLAVRALALARRALVPLRPLVSVAAGADRLGHRLLPSGRPVAGVLGTAQRDMLLGVFSLADTTVADVMTPRLDVVAVEADADWHELIELVRRGEHARIPVYRDSLDDVAGMLYAKDLVPAAAGVAPVPAPWQELIRPAQYVPESKPLAEQLRDFQRAPAHIAIVVDEFGGTSGLITLEDVLEEIVGEIRDEYDVDEEPAIAREGDARFWVDGRVTLDDLSAALGTSLEHEEVNTVGGLVYRELGRVPRPGEELRIDGYRVVVEQVVRRRVRRVYFERLEEAGERAEALRGEET